MTFYVVILSSLAVFLGLTIYVAWRLSAIVQGLDSLLAQMPKVEIRRRVLCGIESNGVFCRALVTWDAEWSDRGASVCDDHRDYIRMCYEEDHSYDQTGLHWVNLKTGKTEIEGLPFQRLR